MNRTFHYGHPGFSGRLSPGVKGLLIANCGAYLLQTFVGHDIVYLFGLTPRAFWAEKVVWQPVTYMFLHGGLFHLLFNMLALWIFGGTLESVWGTKRFLKFYFITGIGAGLSNCILTPGMGIPIIGASGAVYGLLAAYGLLFPNSIIYIYALFPIKAKWLVLIFGVFEFLSSIQPGTSSIANLVHLGGMVIGIVYLKWGSMMIWGARKIRRLQQDRENVQKERTRATEAQLRHEVDELLDKINEVGMENLTSWEKRRLKEASELLKQMEESE